MEEIVLVHQGSAVALLCELYEYWLDYDEAPGGKLGADIKRLLSEDRVDHLPLAERAMRASLMDEGAFQTLLKSVYREYVVERFERLAVG